MKKKVWVVRSAQIIAMDMGIIAVFMTKKKLIRWLRKHATPSNLHSWSITARRRNKPLSENKVPVYLGTAASFLAEEEKKC